MENIITSPKQRNTTTAQSASPPYLVMKSESERRPDLQSNPVPTTNPAATAYKGRLRWTEIVVAGSAFKNA